MYGDAHEGKSWSSRETPKPPPDPEVPSLRSVFIIRGGFTHLKSCQVNGMIQAKVVRGVMTPVRLGREGQEHERCMECAWGRCTKTHGLH